MFGLKLFNVWVSPDEVSKSSLARVSEGGFANGIGWFERHGAVLIGIGSIENG